jgi:hypothetical protein
MAGGILCFFCGNGNPNKNRTECYCFGKGEYYKCIEDLEFKRKIDILNNISFDRVHKTIHIKDNISLLNCLNEIDKDMNEDVTEKIYYFNTKPECIQYVTNYYEILFKKYNII